MRLAERCRSITVAEKHQPCVSLSAFAVLSVSLDDLRQWAPRRGLKRPQWLLLLSHLP